jgi:hypothetical protein
MHHDKFSCILRKLVKKKYTKKPFWILTACFQIIQFYLWLVTIYNQIASNLCTKSYHFKIIISYAVFVSYLQSWEEEFLPASWGKCTFLTPYIVFHCDLGVSPNWPKIPTPERFLLENARMEDTRNVHYSKRPEYSKQITRIL